MLALSVVFIFAQAWPDLHIPEYMSNITFFITSETKELTPILVMGGKMVLCALGSLFRRWLWTFLPHGLLPALPKEFAEKSFVR